ncbi:MAG: aminopeptidase P family protein [Prevotella sp.]|uniref:aminopeptidase P family protein n=1 Tax=Prevotella sp. TaxID=59823 RepID=UPI002A2BA12A|nr:aminopeptidase P family protein [Prevotella sp.]MDD7317904.1 aminopeptidase P family protein [Prevotellaceae bacterium]MDY4020795.1 aminopeptidase P family protein [Prevotella sp.]
MEQTINEKISALRELMRREGIGAFIFPSTDPHNSEYVADHWKGREWITGFHGSAGTAVVTMDAAALWTDSRYFIAAAEQLKGTEFVLMKERIAGTPTITEWIGEMLSRRSEERTLNAQRSTEVAIDGSIASETTVEQLKADLRKEGGLTLRTNIDPLRTIWTDRPPLPTAPIEIHPMKYAGKSARDKITEIRAALRREHADGMLVAALDDIAWTLNLRGNDVHCNPVFVAYLLIDSKKATLFTDRRKLSDAVEEYLGAEGVTVDDYENTGQALKDYFEYNILISPDEVNHTLYSKVERDIVRRASPIPYLKAIKNEAEIEGFRQAMIRDGVAMVKFLHWLKPAVKNGGQTERSVSERLTSLRAEQPLFRGISFDTIAGYEAHGAIVHYEATEATDSPLKAEGLLLIDSGAQYQDGTTDITRTVALGTVGEEQRHIYTLVLKGHIQLAMLCFPDGASGTQLDVLARKDMWAEGLNFLHGTGHGVGSYLCVHEGPQQIRMEYRPAGFHAGMTVTNEPGIYLEGRFGVRIENLMIAAPYKATPFGNFLRFETLTLCPIDTAPIDVTMLTDKEKEWLNNYHATVFTVLSPHLDGGDLEWLREATQPL